MNQQRATSPTDIEPNPFMRLTPEEHPQMPRKVAPEQAPRPQAMIVRMSPTGPEPDPENTSLPIQFSHEQSILLDVTNVLPAQRKLETLVSDMEEAIDAHYSGRELVKITRVRAVWHYNGEVVFSYTDVMEQNVEHVLDLVVKGSPNAFLCFEYEEQIH